MSSVGALGEMLSGINLWYWFGFSILLFAVEVLMGGGFIFWIGIAAALTGVLTWLFPAITWPLQMMFFALSAVTSAVVWWRYLQTHPLKTDRPSLNRRGEQYIGQIYTLSEPIVNGRGTIRVDDSKWRIQCQEDLSVGDKIIITGIEGTTLLAKKQP